MDKEVLDFLKEIETKTPATDQDVMEFINNLDQDPSLAAKPNQPTRSAALNPTTSSQRPSFAAQRPPTRPQALGIRPPTLNPNQPLTQQVRPTQPVRPVQQPVRPIQQSVRPIQQQFRPAARPPVQNVARLNPESTKQELRHPTRVPAGAQIETVFTPPQEFQAEKAERQPDEPDFWNTLWNVTSKGLGAAKDVASRTVQAVSTNEKVRELYANVTPEIGKLRQDFSMLASTLTDTLAPPIEPIEIKKQSVVWACFQVTDQVLMSRYHEMLQECADEAWLIVKGAPNAFSEKVVVNSVQDPEPLASAQNLAEAVAHAEQVLSRLEKLMPEDEAMHLFLVVQPFSSEVSSQLGSSVHLVQYLVLLLCDHGGNLIYHPLVSQSVTSESQQQEHLLVVKAALSQACNKLKHSL
ncbi:hypothetical protein EDD86DRAFT_215478, partial [Gorgonomyces haynaldii]